jgi:hypothetical protein
MEKGELESVQIKRIGVVSLANLSAITYVFFGLISGIFITISSLIVPITGSFGIFDILFGGASIIILPIFYGIVGWFMGALGALIYNLAAKITKGIELYS